MVAALLLTALGGACAVTWAAGWPAKFRATFAFVPGDHVKMLRFAWVGGCIDGAYAAAVLGSVYGAVAVRRRWQAASRPRFAVLSPTPLPPAVDVL
jgi:hypothetical protein